MLSYLLKMPDLENHYRLDLEEEEDVVVLKVGCHSICSIQTCELVAWAYHSV